MKKKLIKLVVLLLLVVSTFSCCQKLTGDKEIELNQAVEGSDLKFTIQDVQFSESGYLIETCNNDVSCFEPVHNKNELDYGDNFLKCIDEEYGFILITMLLENVGKSDVEIDSIGSVDYDNGYKYESDDFYVLMEDGSWDKYGSMGGNVLKPLRLKPLTTGTVKVQVPIPVPKAVFEDDNKSLIFRFERWIYTIR